MKIWFDTEFIDDGKTIDLISIGLVREDGHYYYALNSECNYERAGPWVQKNVLPHLTTGPRNTRAELAADIVKFAGENPEFWAYYADYDWVALCQLYGAMMQLPDGWPKFCMDVKQLCVMRGNPRLPTQKNGTEHHALEDARWTMTAWKFLQGLAPSEKVHIPYPTTTASSGDATKAATIAGPWHDDKGDLLEALAALEHEQWIAWASSLVRHEGRLSDERVARWRLLMVPYAQLTESEKEQDRGWARRVLKCLPSARKEIPDGWRLVPEIVTDDMRREAERWSAYRPHLYVQELWNDMLHAAPSYVGEKSGG